MLFHCFGGAATDTDFVVLPYPIPRHAYADRSLLTGLLCRSKLEGWPDQIWHAHVKATGQAGPKILVQFPFHGRCRFSISAGKESGQTVVDLAQQVAGMLAAMAFFRASLHAAGLLLRQQKQGERQARGRGAVDAERAAR